MFCMYKIVLAYVLMWDLCASLSGSDLQPKNHTKRSRHPLEHVLLLFCCMCGIFLQYAFTRIMNDAKHAAISVAQFQNTLNCLHTSTVAVDTCFKTEEEEEEDCRIERWTLTVLLSRHKWYYQPILKLNIHALCMRIHHHKDINMSPLSTEIHTHTSLYICT